MSLFAFLSDPLTPRTSRSLGSCAYMGVTGLRRVVLVCMTPSGPLACVPVCGVYDLLYCSMVRQSLLYATCCCFSHGVVPLCSLTGGRLLCLMLLMVMSQQGHLLRDILVACHVLRPILDFLHRYIVYPKTSIHIVMSYGYTNISASVLIGEFTVTILRLL